MGNWLQTGLLLGDLFGHWEKFHVHHITVSRFGFINLSRQRNTRIQTFYKQFYILEIWIGYRLNVNKIKIHCILLIIVTVKVKNNDTIKLL